MTGLCEDINECYSMPCDDASTDECTNLPGAFSCNCSAGFQFFNITHCAGTDTYIYVLAWKTSKFFAIPLVILNADIDECATMPCSADSNCVNLVNMFMCDCDAGFAGVTCEIS